VSPRRRTARARPRRVGRKRRRGQYGRHRRLRAAASRGPCGDPPGSRRARRVARSLACPSESAAPRVEGTAARTGRAVAPLRAGRPTGRLGAGERRALDEAKGRAARELLAEAAEAGDGLGEGERALLGLPSAAEARALLEGLRARLWVEPLAA
jgi:hypothetical protein